MRPDKFVEEIKKPYEEKLKFTKKRLKEHPSTMIAWSGGEESTILVVLSREMGMEHPVMHVNSGFEFPEVTDYIEEIKEKYDIENYYEATAEPDLNSIDEFSDFCFKVKWKPAIECVLKHGNGEEFIGFRWKEGNRWKTILEEDFGNKWHGIYRRFALVFWDDKDVNTFYREREDLEKLPLYSKGFQREGCFVCPHASEKMIKMHYPEIYEKRKEYQEKYPKLFKSKPWTEE